jgi:hypothetical protein
MRCPPLAAAAAGQVLVLPVGDVLPGLVVAVLLRQSEVDDGELVAVAPNYLA